MMKAFAQDARRLSLLFHYGVLDAGFVISWADAVIAEMDSPPDLLLQLATTAPEKTGDVLSFLRDLSSGADFADTIYKEFVQEMDDSAKAV